MNYYVEVSNIYIFKNTVARHAKAMIGFRTKLNALSNYAIFNCQTYQVMQ